MLDVLYGDIANVVDVCCILFVFCLYFVCIYFELAP